MNRFAGTQPTGFVRKAFWIAVAAIIVMLAWATAGLSDDGCCPSFDYGPRGMMRPDGTIQQRVGHNPPIDYTAKPQRNGSYLILRNGVAWITLSTQKNQMIAIGDPNGTGQPVVKIDQTSGHGGGAPVKLRAPAP